MIPVRKFDLLVAVYTGCVDISELMGAKTVPLFSIGHFHLHSSVALLVVPLLFAINDIIVEVHGKQRARSVVFSGFLVIVMLLAMSLIATNLPSTERFKASEPAYDAIFGTSARIAAASLTAFAFSELLDVWIFNKIRERMGKKALWLRNNVSSFAGQFVDTTMFMTLAFYAIGKPFGGNASFLLGLIVPYWLLKCFMSVIETPFVYLGVRWLRNSKEA